jgi:hypothetical protein
MFLMYGDESLDETAARVVGTEDAWSSLEAE